jgi:hypothetical protein
VVHPVLIVSRFELGYNIRVKIGAVNLGPGQVRAQDETEPGNMTHFHVQEPNMFP